MGKGFLRYRGASNWARSAGDFWLGGPGGAFSASCCALCSAKRMCASCKRCNIDCGIGLVPNHAAMPLLSLQDGIQLGDVARLATTHSTRVRVTSSANPGYTSLTASPCFLVSVPAPMARTTWIGSSMTWRTDRNLAAW